MIKRGREEPEVDAASCPMLLSRVGQPDSFAKPVVSGRTFTFMTCHKKFTSFQALGGQRASHRKTRLAGEDSTFELPSSPPKPKTHECSICGVEFPNGQALGGHMRRHRAAIENRINNNNITSSRSTSNGFPVSTSDELGAREISPVPKVMKATSCRIFGVDLGMTPVDQMDLKLELGKTVMTPPLLDLFV